MNINSRVVLAMVAVVGVICTSIPLSENNSGEQECSHQYTCPMCENCPHRQKEIRILPVCVQPTNVLPKIEQDLPKIEQENEQTSDRDTLTDITCVMLIFGVAIFIVVLFCIVVYVFNTVPIKTILIALGLATPGS